MPGYVAHPAARKVETQMPNPGQPLVRTNWWNGWACCTLRRFWKGRGHEVWSEGEAAILMCHRPLLCTALHERLPDHWSLPLSDRLVLARTGGHLQCNRGARDRAKAPSIRGNLIYWLFRLLAATITGLARFSYVLLFWASPTYECNEFARKIGCQRKKEQ
jgi:hypothetical protein